MSKGALGGSIRWWEGVLLFTARSCKNLFNLPLLRFNIKYFAD